MPERSSFIFILSLFLSFSAYLVISLVISILTPKNPLPYSILLDLVGSALMFGFPGVIGIIAPLDAKTKYAAMGGARTGAPHSQQLI